MLRAALMAAGVLLAGSYAGAQGVSAGALPEFERTAQALALGDGAAAVDGLNALGVNPAGLHVSRGELLSQFQRLPWGGEAARLGVAYPFKPIGTTAALSVLQLRSPGYEGRDELGRAQGGFSTQDSMVALHLSRPLSLSIWDAASLQLGAGVKYLRSGVASYQGNAWAGDLGARLRFDEAPLSLGVAVLNWGRGPKLLQEESPLPTRLVGSAAWRASRRLTASLAASRRQVERSTDFTAGLEYAPVDLLILRGRYSVSPDGGEPAEGALAFGLGFALFGHAVDYAFKAAAAGVPQAEATHLLTLTLRFGAREEDDGGPAARSGGVEEPSPRRAAADFFRSAEEALRAGLFSSAVAELEHALDADPGHAAARALLPRLRRVAAILPQAIGAESPLPELRLAAAAYAGRQDAARAVLFLRRAFAENPANDAVLAFLNLVEGESGAAELTRRGAAEPAVGFVAGKLQGAREAVYAGRYAVAISRCQDVLEIDPRNARALSIMGTAYYLLRDLARARAAWTRAFEIDPGDQTLAEALRRFRSL